MKDALNYDINLLCKKQCVSISRILIDHFKDCIDYYNEKDYCDDVLGCVEKYLDTVKKR